MKDTRGNLIAMSAQLEQALSRIRELEAELAETLKLAVEKLVNLRRELVETKAELQVRDNMGNEVLRILREATGRRDFHSEMEAAEWAAKMLAEARLDGARLQTALKAAMVVLSGQETSKTMLIRALELGRLAIKEAK